MDNFLKNFDYKKAFLFFLLCLAATRIFENSRFFINIILKFLGAITPFIWGLVFAYMLNPLMLLIERKFKIKKRGISLSFTYIVFLGILLIFTIFVTPMILKNAMDLYSKSDVYSNDIIKFIDKMPNKEFIFKNLNLEDSLRENKTNIIELFLKLFNMTINSILSTVMNFTSAFLNIILGICVSMYLLYDKDKLLKRIKIIIYAVCNKDTAENIYKYLSKVNFYFYNFFIGKLVDSSIIGMLCYVGLLAMKVKYALLLSIIVGVFNMIPYFGPFIGAIPALIITLLDSPYKALWVGVFIFILQQFDGWVLGPKILGDKVGASPLFIIFSILVGGTFFGAIGMFVAVPVFKSLYIFCEIFIQEKLKDKKIKYIE